MTYSDAFNIRTTSVKFNDVADAIDGGITRSFGGITSGTSTAYIATPTPAWTSYDQSASLIIIPHTNNTAGSPAITINVSGLGTKEIKLGGGNLPSDCFVGFIPVLLVYTGTQFEVVAGENAIPANLNFNGLRPTNVAAGTAAAPAYCAGNDSDTGMFSPAGGNQLGFATAGSERARFNSSGDFGIGTTSPSYRLDVSQTVNASNAIRVINADTGASANAQILWGNNTSVTAASIVINSSANTANSGTNSFNIIQGLNAPMGFWVNTSERMRIKGDGEVLVGGVTDNGAYNLQCNGTGVWGAGAYFNGSDARIKEDIAPLSNSLDLVKNLNPVTFKYKNTWSKDQSIQPGFIAQEVALALQQTSYVDGIVQQGGDYMGLAYQNLIPLLVKSIQELVARVEYLENPN